MKKSLKPFLVAKDGQNNLKDGMVYEY